MKCYKCGSFLTDGDTCPQCGENVRIYKKTARVSDAYYNAGLYKARVRDLTGAVESLKISLMINKYNTNARNLLGLVYCEMGDVVEALSQWVVSKNFTPEGNIAGTIRNHINAAPITTPANTFIIVIAPLLGSLYDDLGRITSLPLNGFLSISFSFLLGRKEPDVSAFFAAFLSAISF